MKRFMDPVNLNYFEALASKTRLKIVQLLAEKDRNIKELSEELGISSSITVKHVKKLESARIINTSQVYKDGSNQKVCSLLNGIVEIHVPFKVNRGDTRKNLHETSIPVGQFTDLEASAPCGIACEEETLGDLDDAVGMFNPERGRAQLLWFGEGFVEYTVPNYRMENHRLTDIEVTGEFGSEVAGFNDNWPSSINMYLNGKLVCSFTTPGDMGSTRGSLTPGWWTNNQYGILVIIRVNEDGVVVNGEKKSDLTPADFGADCTRWKLRFEATHHSGGFTVFGEKFGNYGQNIMFRQFYEEAAGEE